MFSILYMPTIPTQFLFAQVSNASGEMKVTRVANTGTFRKEQLISDDCFILDTAGKIFVWKGKSKGNVELLSLYFSPNIV